MRLPCLGVLSLILLSAFAGCTSEETSDRPPSQKQMSGPYFGQSPPGSTPERFAPAIISAGLVAHSAPVFSPDGKEVCWSAYSATFQSQKVYVSSIQNGGWTTPRAASFSGEFNDGTPLFSLDGKTLYFSSMRPREPGGPEGMGYVWVVERTETGWSDPRPVNDAVNWTRLSMQVAVSGDGSIYHAAWAGAATDNADIYLSRFTDGAYAEPERLGDEVNSDFQDVAPCLAPDGSYLVFTSMARHASVGGADLFVCFRTPDGSWTRARNLGSPINSEGMEVFCSISPDGKYFFFTSDRGGKPAVYWVKTSVIEALRE